MTTTRTYTLTLTAEEAYKLAALANAESTRQAGRYDLEAARSMYAIGQQLVNQDVCAKCGAQLKPANDRLCGPCATDLAYRMEA